MPQLDFIIIFPQIFWLLIVFLFTYIILSHFFLPIFIKTLKSRKYIILENTKILIKTQNKFNLKQTQLSFLLNRNFKLIKVMLETEIFSLFSEDSNIDLNLVNIKLIEALYYNILYYNSNVLDSIPLKLRLSHLKFNN
nr:ATP synthase F0 subunit 8 [Synarthrophyton patena]